MSAACRPATHYQLSYIPARLAFHTARKSVFLISVFPGSFHVIFLYFFQQELTGVVKNYSDF